LPDGFFLSEEHHGKIYERLADGSEVRPLDFSITKAVLQIWIVVAILIIVFLSCARWYKKRDAKSDAPKGFVGMMEMLVTYLNDDLIRPSIGEKHYKQYAPYLLTLFFFILTCNLIGLIPIFPAGANVTGNINITFFLALCTMLAINIFANKEYWKEIFWPDVPLFLKAYPAPVMPVIELFGVFTKPFALMIRLFANMMAGHAVILSFTCVIFLGWSMGVGFGLGLNAFSIIMLLFMNLLEVLVAFVQAYVFTMLSAVFIGLAHKEHGEE
jgi:F-type H+-transporting ATPase subunit a